MMASHKILRVAALVIAAPFAVLAAFILTPFLPLLVGGRAECVADGIVPASRRYDFDFRAEVENKAK